MSSFVPMVMAEDAVRYIQGETICPGNLKRFMMGFFIRPNWSLAEQVAEALGINISGSVARDSAKAQQLKKLGREMYFGLLRRDSAVLPLFEKCRDYFSRRYAAE